MVEDGNTHSLSAKDVEFIEQLNNCLSPKRYYTKWSQFLSHRSTGVGFVTRLRAGWPRNPGLMPGSGRRLFSSPTIVQTDFGAHTASYTLSMEGNAVRLWRSVTYFHLVPRFSISGVISPLSSRLQNTHKDSLTFTFTITFTSPTSGVQLWQNLPAFYNVVRKRKGNFQ